MKYYSYLQKLPWGKGSEVGEMQRLKNGTECVKTRRNAP